MSPLYDSRALDSGPALTYSIIQCVTVRGGSVIGFIQYSTNQQNDGLFHSFMHSFFAFQISMESKCPLSVTFQNQQNYSCSTYV